MGIKNDNQENVALSFNQNTTDLRKTFISKTKQCMLSYVIVYRFLISILFF